MLDALVTAEVALVRARGALGLTPAGVVDRVSDALGWTAPGEPCRGHAIDAAALAAASVAGGNPVIPLVGAADRRRSGAEAEVHRGATSQDILDSALMLVAARAAREVVSVARRDGGRAARVRRARIATRSLPRARSPSTPCPPRSGLRAANWLRGVQRAIERAGCRGRRRCRHSWAAPAARSRRSSSCTGRMPRPSCRAAFAARARARRARRAVAHDPLARHRTGRRARAGHRRGRRDRHRRRDARRAPRSASSPKASAADRRRCRRSRTRRHPSSSARPRCAHPSSARRCISPPAFAVDERPDGAWHAEWPTLRELLRLALGATGTAARLVGRPAGRRRRRRAQPRADRRAHRRRAALARARAGDRQGRACRRSSRPPAGARTSPPCCARQPELADARHRRPARPGAATPALRRRPRRPSRSRRSSHDRPADRPDRAGRARRGAARSCSGRRSAPRRSCGRTSCRFSPRATASSRGTCPATAPRPPATRAVHGRRPRRCGRRGDRGPRRRARPLRRGLARRRHRTGARCCGIPTSSPALAIVASGAQLGDARRRGTSAPRRCARSRPRC